MGATGGSTAWELTHCRVALVYKDKAQIDVGSSGSEGFDEFKAYLQDKSDQAVFGFLRLISGDQESRRVKFVFFVFLGTNLGAMAKVLVSDWQCS